MKNDEKLVNLCSLVMLAAHDLKISTIHFDTTSKSVQGVYENGAFGDFLITYGYSKDQRPDLKQFKIGLQSSRTASLSWARSSQATNRIKHEPGSSA